jgi:hypothetical protein
MKTTATARRAPEATITIWTQRGAFCQMLCTRRLIRPRRRADASWLDGDGVTDGCAIIYAFQIPRSLRTVCRTRDSRCEPDEDEMVQFGRSLLLVPIGRARSACTLECNSTVVRCPTSRTSGAVSLEKSLQSKPKSSWPWSRRAWRAPPALPGHCGVRERALRFRRSACLSIQDSQIRIMQTSRW